MMLMISIHALRKESDGRSFDGIDRRFTISIHALRKESDRTRAASSSVDCIFQSTLSVRRATALAAGPSLAVEISIHALRKESDPKGDASMKVDLYFNQRSP